MKLLSILLLAFAAALPSAAQQPAFPGAEGFGMYTTGGRGGTVYHVTTLEDNSQKGTLRYALGRTGPKTIVFDVSGTICLNSKLDISKGDVTIAGQTAPGDGICIAGYPVTIKADNVIIRYLRFRLGNENVTVDGADSFDGLGGFDHKDIIVDHCSVSWSIDECLSIYGNKNSTVQWCIVDQSLVEAGHSKGEHGYGGNWGGSGASYHHNLMAHHTSRVPRLGPRYTTQLDERMDMRNNVFYNWAGNGCYGGEAMNVNIVNNYYKPGPATDKASSKVKYRIAGIGIRTNEYITKYPDYAPTLHKWGTFYVAGNVNPDHKDKITAKDQWTYGIYAQVETKSVDGTFTDQVKKDMRLSAPIACPSVTTHTAEKAYEKVLAYAGASLSRDSHDTYIVGDVRDRKASYTGAGRLPGLVNSQDEAGGFPQLKEEYSDGNDSDGDGIPDTWEDANGLEKYNKADGATVTADGYTNLEHYLNSLVAHITEAQNADAATAIEEIKGASLANTPSNSNVYTLDGRCVRKDADNLCGLAKGMYIHKGKTVVID